MDLSKVTMLSTRLLVKLIEEESKTKGGIIIPNVAKERPTRGQVLVSGPGLQTLKGDLIPNTAKVNDVILFPKNAGVEVKLDKDTYLVIEEKDVMLVIGE